MPTLQELYDAVKDRANGIKRYVTDPNYRRLANTESLRYKKPSNLDVQKLHYNLDRWEGDKAAFDKLKALARKENVLSQLGANGDYYDFNNTVRQANGRVMPKVYSKVPSRPSLGGFPIRDSVRDYALNNPRSALGLLTLSGLSLASLLANPYPAIGTPARLGEKLKGERFTHRVDNDLANALFPEGVMFPNISGAVPKFSTSYPYVKAIPQDLIIGGSNAGVDFYTGYQEPETHQMTMKTVSASRAEEEAMQEAAQKAMAGAIGGRLPQSLSRAAAEEQMQAILGPSLYGQMMTKGIPVDPNNEYVAQLDENGQPFYLAENM